VVGVAETLRMVELACPPEHVSDEPLVRMVMAESRHTPSSWEDFIVLASEVIMASWPCN
jgi:hypothetical protein